MGAVHVRRTRRRGHDLASVTLCCGVDEAGLTRLAYGSVGPRPVLAVDESGVLADRAAPDEAKAAILERVFAAASPSPRSMRAGPEYRLAMLRPRRSRHRDRPSATGARLMPTRLIEMIVNGCTLTLDVATITPARRPARRPRPDRDQGVLPRG
jgi:hypothetical protein